MSFEQDSQLKALLSGWNAPSPSDDAVARILAAAHSPKSLGRQRIFAVVSALAATLVFGVLTLTPHDVLPKNEPILQQSALGVFLAAPSHTDAEELP